MAFLLCGNWHDAQDVTQTALMDLCGAWNQARRADSIDAYAHRVLVRTYLSQRRKVLRQQSRAAEYALANERTAASPEQPELRMALLAALAQVPPRGRAVLILRFWEDGVPHPELAAKYAQAMAAADKLPTTISPSRFTVEAAGGQASVDVNYWPPTDGHHPPSDQCRCFGH
jgi:RNA polymerase sigma factor (sigma-70 family)